MLKPKSLGIRKRKVFMSKYDFGYDIQKGSTAEWAYGLIKEKSEVLEIGPAIGTLAKHLKEEKQCQVDIVEIDSDAGKNAEKFARHACIGEIEGDVERPEWFEAYKEMRYDYIVLLDVIEHIRYPERLLEKLKELLKKEGYLLISTPNIAHNSIIINLLNNYFEYTDVGILDNTHLKFYTYYSFCQLLHDAGFTITRKDYIQKRVGENEIPCNYNEVSNEVEAYLRERKLADVYQFTFMVKKGGKEDASDFPENLPYTAFQFETYNSGKLYSQEFFDGKNLDIAIALNECRDDNFRIDPINTNAIISDISIYDVENDCPIKIKMMNGGKIDDKRVVFFDNDPQIFIDTTVTGSLIRFKCHFETINNNAINKLQSLWAEVLEFKNQVCIVEETNKELYNMNEEINLENQEIKKENQRIRLENEKKTTQIAQLEHEIQTIKNTKFWKIYSKLFKKEINYNG